MGECFLMGKSNTSSQNNNTNGEAPLINGSREISGTFIESVSEGDLVNISYNSNTLYRNTKESFPKIDGYAMAANKIAYSPDGKYLAVAYSKKPNVRIYKITNDGYVELPMSFNDEVTVRSMEFSPNGKHLAVGTYLSRTPLYIYKIDSNEVVTRSSLFSLSSDGYVNDLSYSSDGKYLSVICNSGNFLYVYGITNDTYSSITISGDKPKVFGEVTKFTPDGNYLVAITSADTSTTTAPNFFVYDVKNSFNVVKSARLLTDAKVLSFSNDGLYFMVSRNYSPYLSLYKFNDGNPSATEITFEKPTELTRYPTIIVSHPTENYFIVSGGLSGYYPKLQVYKYENDIVTYEEPMDIAEIYSTLGAAFSTNGDKLFLANSIGVTGDNSQVLILEPTEVTIKFEKLKNKNELLDKSLGVALVDGVVGEQGQVLKILN